MAIKAKDGLVMASDLQRSGTFREYAPKIKLVRPTELLGCAGGSGYIGVFRRHATRELTRTANPDYHQALNDAIESYSEYLNRKINTQGLTFIDDMRVEGLLAVHDPNSGYRLFQFKIPHPCQEVELILRAAAGSGGDIATVLMKTAEEIMDAARIENHWERFPSKVIKQFCWLVLERIARIEPWSSGRDIQVLTEQGSTGISPSERIFQSDLFRLQVGEFATSVFSELGSPMPRFLADRFGLLELFRNLRSMR